MKQFLNISAASGNVVLNFSRDPVGDLETFASGYREAAKTLANRFGGNAYADYDGYPVLFLYRHALELALKAVVYRGAAMMSLLDEEFSEPPLFKDHSLSRLLPAVKEIFKGMKWTFDGTAVGSLQEFERVIQEIESVDPLSFAFRYPVDKRGEALLPRHTVVHVPNFGDVIGKIIEFLENVSCTLRDRFQETAEARHELLELLGKSQS